jgi:hypothetical protein
MAGNRAVELDNFKGRSCVMVPQLVAFNAVKFADLPRQKRVDDGAARHALATRRRYDNIAAVTAQGRSNRSGHERKLARTNTHVRL